MLQDANQFISLDALLKEGFLHHFQIAGATGSGKTTLMNYLASHNLSSLPYSSILKITRAEEPLLGFENNPWIVDLEDGSTLELSDYLVERPKGIAHLYFDYFKLNQENFDKALFFALELSRKHNNNKISTPLFLHIDDIDFLVSASLKSAIFATARKYNICVYAYCYKWSDNCFARTNILFKQSLENLGLIGLTGLDSYAKLNYLANFEFLVFNSNKPTNAIFKLDNSHQG